TTARRRSDRAPRGAVQCLRQMHRQGARVPSAEALRLRVRRAGWRDGSASCVLVSSFFVEAGLDLQRRRPCWLRGFLFVGFETGYRVHRIAEHRETELLARLVVSLRNEARQIADTANIGRAFGD